MAKGRFPLSPEAFGNKWLGRVRRFGEMTAAEFDELRQASLSERIGPDAVIMYLETEDVQNPEQGRATFFTLDTRPVSKWARFVTSLKENCDIVLRDYDDLVGKVLWFQEREEEMGKLGRQRVLEVTGIFSRKPPSFFRSRVPVAYSTAPEFRKRRDLKTEWLKR